MVLGFHKKEKYPKMKKVSQELFKSERASFLEKCPKLLTTLSLKERHSLGYVGGTRSVSAGSAPAAAASPHPARAPASRRPSRSHQDAPGPHRRPQRCGWPGDPATQGPEQQFTENPEGTAPRGLGLPAPAGTTTPKLKPGRLGHFWSRPRRSH